MRTGVLMVLGVLLALIALGGAAFAVVSARIACAHIKAAPRRPAPAEVAPAVTVLKPLHGAEPCLRESLESFCRQDYAGPVQIVFGVHDHADGAVPIVRELQRAHPERHIELVVDGRVYGENRKVSNLINMSRRIAHDVVVLSDSDISVRRDYLDQVVERLHRPQVGLVTCLYVGEAGRGVWSQLAAMGVSYQFLPNAVLGARLGLAEPCFGATIALRRQALEAIGGFEVLKDQLADDYDLGAAVRALGFKGEVASTPVVHRCEERSFSELWRHEMRWARTIRMIDPGGFVGQGLTYATPWALLGCIATAFHPAATAALLATAAARLYLVARIDGATGTRAQSLWLLALRDLLSLAVFVAASFGQTVTWRGRRYRVDAAGALSPAVLGPDPEYLDASHPLPAGALLRRLRRGRGLALPGQAGDQVLLVPDLAGPARRLGREQPAGRRPAA